MKKYEGFDLAMGCVTTAFVTAVIIVVLFECFDGKPSETMNRLANNGCWQSISVDGKVDGLVTLDSLGEAADTAKMFDDGHTIKVVYNRCEGGK